MADPVTAMTVIAGVGAAGKAVGAMYKMDAADSAIEGLEMQSRQQTLHYQQKTLNNYDITQKVLDRQIAQATVKGVGMGSASLNAIQRNTLNISAKEGMNLDIEEALGKSNIDIEKANVRRSLASSLFGDIFETGMSFAKIGEKMPSKSSSSKPIK